MSGWPAVAVITLMQIAAAAVLARTAARRWWDYLVIAVLTAALVYAIWSDGSEGKDQVIYASAASTILLPLIVSAFAVYALRQAWRALHANRR